MDSHEQEKYARERIAESPFRLLSVSAGVQQFVSKHSDESLNKLIQEEPPCR